MRHLTAISAFAIILSAAAAQAATTTSPQTGQPPAYATPVIANADAMKGVDAMHQTNLRQQLHDQLTKAGFTDIKIMPSSFYVQAKDKKGEPVTMVIGPDSFAEVTEVNTQNRAPTPAPSPQASAQPQASQQTQQK